jgi:hypothetical protein
MRTGYLVAAVMLFTSGAAAAQSTDGGVEVTTTGESNISARAAARLERRTERRERRDARLNSLRAARGLQTRNESQASGFAAIEESARLMFIPADESLPADDAPESEDPADQPADEGEPQIFQLTLTVEEEGFAEEETLECEIYDDEGNLVEVPEECYDDESADEPYVDGGPVNDDFEFPEGEEWPLIYTLGGADAEIMFRGNAGEHSQGRALGLNVPLDEIRASGEARSGSHAAAQAEVGTAHRAASPERSAQVLARRLAQIDSMRDRALAEGNTALLETADRLEASARLRYQTAAGDETSTTEPIENETTSESHP